MIHFRHPSISIRASPRHILRGMFLHVLVSKCRALDTRVSIQEIIHFDFLSIKVSIERSLYHRGTEIQELPYRRPTEEALVDKCLQFPFMIFHHHMLTPTLIHHPFSQIKPNAVGKLLFVTTRHVACSVHTTVLHQRIVHYVPIHRVCLFGIPYQLPLVDEDLQSVPTGDGQPALTAFLLLPLVGEPLSDFYLLPVREDTHACIRAVTSAVLFVILFQNVTVRVPNNIICRHVRLKPLLLEGQQPRLGEHTVTVNIRKKREMQPPKKTSSCFFLSHQLQGWREK